MPPSDRRLPKQRRRRRRPKQKQLLLKQKRMPKKLDGSATGEMIGVEALGEVEVEVVIWAIAIDRRKKSLPVVPSVPVRLVQIPKRRIAGDSGVEEVHPALLVEVVVAAVVDQEELAEVVEDLVSRERVAWEETTLLL